jgi:lysophospholipase L1-like esterase
MKTSRFFLLFSSLLVAGYLSCQSPGSAAMTPSTDAAPDSGGYLALGDSYTIGEGVPETDRWSVQLADLLRAQGVPLPSPRIIARTGWTTAELQEAIRKEAPAPRYALVSLLIGVNNQYRGQSLERYRREFRELLHTATGLDGGRAGRVVVLSVPDWSVTPFAASRNRAKIAEEIDAFNAVAAEACRQAGIAFVDITPLSRTALDQPRFIAPDDLHFSGAMYRLWAEKAAPAVRKALEEKVTR